MGFPSTKHQETQTQLPMPDGPHEPGGGGHTGVPGVTGRGGQGEGGDSDGASPSAYPSTIMGFPSTKHQETQTRP